MNYVSEGKIPRPVTDRSAPETCWLCVGSVPGTACDSGSYGPVGGLSSRPGSGGSSLGSSSFHPQGSSRNNLVSQGPGEF